MINVLSSVLALLFSLFFSSFAYAQAPSLPSVSSNQVPSAAVLSSNQSTFEAHTFVRNKTKGANAWEHSVQADPLDEIEFKVEVTSQQNVSLSDAVVKYVLPQDLLYAGNLKIDDKPVVADLISGFVLGDSVASDNSVISFDALVAPSFQFAEGETRLIAVGFAYNTQKASSDTAIVAVQKSVALFVPVTQSSLEPAISSSAPPPSFEDINVEIRVTPSLSATITGRVEGLSEKGIRYRVDCDTEKDLWDTTFIQESREFTATCEYSSVGSYHIDIVAEKGGMRAEKIIPVVIPMLSTIGGESQEGGQRFFEAFAGMIDSIPLPKGIVMPVLLLSIFVLFLLLISIAKRIFRRSKPEKLSPASAPTPEQTQSFLIPPNAADQLPSA